MTPIRQLLQIASDYGKSGNWSEAEQLYRQAVQLDANCGEAWHRLGGIVLQRGLPDMAFEYTQRAAQLLPHDPEVLSDLATTLLILGKPEDAAMVSFRAVQIAPHSGILRFNLGNALKCCGKWEDAVSTYKRAIELAPGLVPARSNLAALWLDQGRLQEALLECRAALQVDSQNAQVLTVLGNVFRRMDKFEDAKTCYQQALQSQPYQVEALCNLGTIFYTEDRFDEALACYQRSLQIQPQFPAALANLAVLLSNHGHFADAWLCFNRALDLDPHHVDARYNRARQCLLLGDFASGWIDYEWRWKATHLQERQLGVPAWSGEPLAGKTILLHAEQGLGDTLQFVRYASVVKRLGAQVIVECQTPLKRLLSSCPGIDHLVARGESLPTLHYQLPLLSLPRVCQTTLETIPTEIPYLRADSALVNFWRAKLKNVGRPRIGLNWRGRSTPGEHKRRDIPPAALAYLRQIPGIHWVNLQKDATAAELAHIGGGQGIFNPGDDIDRANGPFMDTAAIMMNLDLVISSDTSVPHLAGALGVPVWLLLPQIPDWRWLLNRTDSPWYPTMRLFRQQQRGDWDSVMADILQPLAEFAGKF